LGQLETAVFPDSLAAAKECKTAAQIAEWKQAHIQKIMTLKVVGEEDAEESKSGEKKLVTRVSDPLDAGYTLKKNFEFPEAAHLRYDVSVNGFTHDGSNWGMNIILSNGSKSKLPQPALGWESTRMADGLHPTKVICWYNYVNGYSHLNGVQFFDEEGK